MTKPLFVYHADIVNGAGGAGAQTYTATIGQRNQVELLYGEIFNGDTSGRVATVEIDDGTAGENQSELVSVTADAASTHSFPHSDVAAAGGTHLSAGARLILSGAQRIVATVAAVAASQDSSFSFACLIRRGTGPTVVEVGASTPTITVNQEGIL